MKVKFDSKEVEMSFPFYILWEIGDYGFTLARLNEDLSSFDLNFSIENKLESAVFGEYGLHDLDYFVKENYENQAAIKEKFEAAAQKLKIAIDAI